MEPRANYKGKGSPRLYSDSAVTMSLMIRQLFCLPLRQTEGFIQSLIDLLDLSINMMDFSSISKRSKDLEFERLIDSIEAGSHVMVDSTGLKVYGRDEWHQEKHDVLARRTWRKLHIAVDEHHQIVACELTTKEEGDPSVLPDLLEQVDGFDTFMADGAYDGLPTYQHVEKHSSGASVIVPPPKNAVVGQTNPERNQHIEAIEKHGRIGWQKLTGYKLRAYAELAIQRYKRIIGNTMKARELPQQKAEAQSSVRLLNVMTGLGMPISIKIT